MSEENSMDGMKGLQVKIAERAVDLRYRQKLKAWRIRAAIGIVLFSYLTLRYEWGKWVLGAWVVLSLLSLRILWKWRTVMLAALAAKRREGGDETVEKVKALMAPLMRPVVKLMKGERETGSYFGGTPPAFAGFEWPRKEGRPLSFLACVDLGGLGEGRPEWLPETGRLLFFYDVEKGEWGSGPEDWGSWSVIHVPGPGEGEIAAEAPEGLTGEGIFPRRSIEARWGMQAPSGEEAEVKKLGLSDGENEALSEWREEEFGGEPMHQMGGYVYPIQSVDMAEICEATLARLREDGVVGPGGNGAWRLLLQLDSDRELEWMWGDCGMLSFWVREDEARRGDFRQVGFVMECC